MYCGNGKEVEASINEKGTATGGKPGDQTGKEFLIRSYRNYPWTNVLRYAAESQVVRSKKDVTTVAKEVLAGSWGNGDDRKNRLTAAGYDYTAVQAEVNRLASGASTPKRARRKSQKKSSQASGETAMIARRSSRQQDITMRQCRRKSIAWPKVEAPQRKA